MADCENIGLFNKTEGSDMGVIVSLPSKQNNTIETPSAKVSKNRPLILLDENRISFKKSVFLEGLKRKLKKCSREELVQRFNLCALNRKGEFDYDGKDGTLMVVIEDIINERVERGSTY